MDSGGAFVTISPQATRVGFIGLGIMGKPMAGHLVAAGYRVTVHNRSKPAVDALVALGASDGGSAAGVAQASNVVILMVPDTPDVESVVFGSGGFAEACRPGQILIDMSTISPVATRAIAERLAERGVKMLDAPVSGGQKGAVDAALSIMVGGEEDVFTACLPLFQAMGKNIVRIGGIGAGQVCKACNQIVVAVTIEAVAEALTLARKMDVDAAKVRQALLGGFAQSRILDLHGQRMLDGSYQPGFRVNLHHKDLNIALAAGGAANVPLPATAIVQQLFAALRGRGDGDLDHSVLAKLASDLSGLA
jgi:2-hydroxy-3-oxopropionate reductase